GVALSVAVVAGCTPRPQDPQSATASVTVNGNNSTFHNVKCSQVEWYRKIDIGGDFAGATVAVDEHSERASVNSVRIRNLAGFTGMYSQGGDGDANSSLSAGKFTITGTAHGYKADNPNEPATATFKIVVSC